MWKPTGSTNSHSFSYAGDADPNPDALSDANSYPEPHRHTNSLAYAAAHSHTHPAQPDPDTKCHGDSDIHSQFDPDGNSDAQRYANRHGDFYADSDSRHLGEHLDPAACS